MSHTDASKKFSPMVPWCPLTPGARNPELGSACSRQGTAPTRGPDRTRGRDRPAAGASERTLNQSQPAGTDRGRRSRARRRPAFRRAQEEARQATAREVGGAESGRLRSRRAPKLIEAP
ncbi:hypothetical protein NDU88_002952 [Pleurodeles waltl]|uniref:Uncharacterized protein n=1 Tax=Pleurodeles waltl TaxID=8319 RepID=A0AAV7T459_PLEWA|nr:hypothetical protein NDU88_002952 [Pleurodeles waltl]